MALDYTTKIGKFIGDKLNYHLESNQDFGIMRNENAYTWCWLQTLYLLGEPRDLAKEIDRYPLSGSQG